MKYILSVLLLLSMTMISNYAQTTVGVTYKKSNNTVVQTNLIINGATINSDTVIIGSLSLSNITPGVAYFTTSNTNLTNLPFGSAGQQLVSTGTGIGFSDPPPVITSGMTTNIEVIGIDGTTNTLQFSLGILTNYIAGTVAPPMDVASTPTFSPDGGTNVTSNVVITSSSPSPVNIYWTTNGDIPTTNLTAWPSPATVTNILACTLKAIAWYPGVTPSSIKSSEYTVPSTNNCDTYVINYETDNDYYTLASPPIKSQAYTNASGTITVCEVQLRINTSLGSDTNYVEIRTAPNGGGALVGERSAPTVITGPANWFVFTFTNNPSLTNGAYWITPIHSNLGYQYWKANVGAYVTNFGGYAGEAEYTGAGQAQFCVRIKK